MIPAMTHSETLAETVFVTRCDRPAKATLGKRLMSTLTAAVTAVSVLAATAVPAQADRRSDDFAKALAAIAAIAIIADQIGDDRNRGGNRNHGGYNSGGGYNNGGYNHGGYNNHGGYRPPVVHPRPPVPEREHRPRVPAVCAFQIEQTYDSSTVYGERCLRREGFDYRLPGRCAREVRLQGRNDRIYTERCLRDAGFRTGRRQY